MELCWSFYQRLIAAYAHPDRRRGKAMMTTTITTLRSGVPDALEELAQLGRTLWRRGRRGESLGVVGFRVEDDRAGLALGVSLGLSGRAIA